MALLAETVRDIIGILLIVFNQQDLQSCISFAAAVQPFDASGETKTGGETKIGIMPVKLQNPNLTEMFVQS